jgi:hypothetical protein
LLSFRQAEGDELHAAASHCRLLAKQSSLPGIEPVYVAILFSAVHMRYDDSVVSIINRAKHHL